MCLSKITYKIVFLVPLFVKILTLKVLPVENTIFKTESAVRNITNEIFLGLKLKGIKNNAKLKQHSLIHNFFTKLTLKDQYTLAAIATLSRPEENSISNKTQGYIDILNELQQEDAINHEENAITIDFNVIKFIDNFLSRSTYEGNANGFSNHNFDDVLDMLQSDFEDSIFTEYSKEALDDPKVLSDSEFWEPEVSSRRIYRGDRTKIKYFPFMASIQIFQSFQCGGSIIKSDLVITAASCLQLAYNNRFFRENPAFLSVRVGSNFYQGGGENIPVLEVYFHPGYDPKSLKNNLSIVRLVRKINLSKKKKKAKVKKIAIDRHASPLPYNTPGVTIVGWGARTTSNILDNPWSNRLSFSTLDVYPWRDCRDVYSKDYVSLKNFCAGFISKGSGACNKDAGDPGIVKGVLTGVVSFGTPVCGTPDAPTVFTKIGYYADWIDEIIDMPVPETKRKTTLPPPPYEPTTTWQTIKTTFKIQPIGGLKQKPIPIHDVDALRILSEDPELKEILDTMLTDEDEKLVINDELDQLRQATEGVEPKQESELPQSIKPVETKSTKKATRMMTLEPVINLKKYTVLDPNLRKVKSDVDDDAEIDRNIVNIINNLESDSVEKLKDILSSAEIDDEMEPRKVTRVVSDIRTKPTKAITVRGSDGKLNVDSKNIEDSILTLLYLSDEDKENGKKFNKFLSLDEGDDGLSIAIDDFEDFTYRNDNGTKHLYDMLPKNEWYELLSEAIEEVTKNKHGKSLCFISIFICPANYLCKTCKMCCSKIL